MEPTSENNDAAKKVLIDVAERIKNARGDVRERLIGTLVEREIGQRVDVLDKALSKREQLERDIRKLKPDDVSYDGDGNVVSAHYSKAKYEELKKAKDKLAKLDTAIEKALADNDFGKLKDAVNK
jgi:hypothetical protein